VRAPTGRGGNIAASVIGRSAADQPKAGRQCQQFKFVFSHNALSRFENCAFAICICLKRHTVRAVVVAVAPHCHFRRIKCVGSGLLLFGTVLESRDVSD